MGSTKPNGRSCHHCGKGLTGGQLKWCGQTCRIENWRKRQKVDEKKAAALAKADEVARAAGKREVGRRGHGYEEFVSTGLAADVRAGRATQAEVAHLVGVDQATISRWMSQALIDRHHEKQAKTWEPSEKIAAMLEPTPEAFREFYTFAFPVNRKGQPTIVKDFHLEWIEMMLDAYLHGGQKALLCAQRHGKTQILVAFCCWLLLIDPNLPIIWVSATQDMATKAVNNVRVQFEVNENLLRFLPPGMKFKPSSGGRGGNDTSMAWSATEFTIATRTIWHKSPSMVAVGAGGTLLSRDAGLIVMDDIVDHKKVAQAGQREKTKEWAGTDVASRVEDDTAVVYIGSRQHPEDLTSWFDSNPEWEVKTWSAHDPSCQGSWDPNDDDTGPAHPEQHTDCMLFPEYRSFDWLWRTRRRLESQNAFDLRYQNLLVASDTSVFQRPDLEQCYDSLLNMGQVPAEGYRLFAGFDPGGGSGYQAAVLWAVRRSDGHRVLVDVENRKGGGVAHMRELIGRWSEMYPALGTWVFEMNILKDTLEADKQIRDLKGRHNLQFVPHKTNTNKWDRRVGIWAMVGMYQDRNVTIPYGDQATREKAREFVNQHVRFEPEAAGNRHAVFDLVMAAWFPQLTVSRWMSAAVESEGQGDRRPKAVYPGKGRRRLLRSAARGGAIVGVAPPADV